MNIPRLIQAFNLCTLSGEIESSSNYVQFCEVLLVPACKLKNIVHYSIHGTVPTQGNDKKLKHQNSFYHKVDRSYNSLSPLHLLFLAASEIVKHLNHISDN